MHFFLCDEFRDAVGDRTAAIPGQLNRRAGIQIDYIKVLLPNEADVAAVRRELDIGFERRIVGELFDGESRIEPIEIKIAFEWKDDRFAGGRPDVFDDTRMRNPLAFPAGLLLIGQILRFRAQLARIHQQLRRVPGNIVVPEIQDTGFLLVAPQEGDPVAVR